MKKPLIVLLLVLVGIAAFLAINYKDIIKNPIGLRPIIRKAKSIRNSNTQDVFWEMTQGYLTNKLSEIY